jgi:Tol biopolymer transport system component
VRRAQAPYAISAVLVLVVSVALLAGALAMGGLLDERPVSDASPTPSSARGPVELSPASRLAYWRVGPAGGTQLWVANLDGSQRRAIANIDGPSRVQATRWSPDGNAVAYLDSGQAVVVQRLDVAGTRYELALPQFLSSGNARIIDFDWSTDSARIAATVRGGSSGIPTTATDVYVSSATGGGWRNATSLGNAFLSQWISADQLLIHTQNGLIAIQSATGSGLRPLTAQVATSPFLGDDGRVYYFAGQVAPTVRDATVPVINAGQARVWSTTIDGGDIQQELPQVYDDVRLVTRWSPGRFVVHQGASTALAFLASGQPPLQTIPGVVDRVVFSPDRRTAIGLTTTRIVRYDTAQPDNPVVLLSDVVQPDAWYPETVTITRSTVAPAQARPAARYAFALAGLIWVADATGEARLLRQLQANDLDTRRLSGVAIPQWSPDGERILYFDVLSSSFRGAVFVTDATGTGGRLSDQDAAGPFPTWSPDGNVAYTDLLFSFDSAGFGAAGEVRIVNPTSSARVATYRAREIAFGGGKTYLIDNGRLESPAGYTDHAILEATARGSRTLTTAAVLDAGSAFAGQSPGPVTLLQLSMLGASADGEYLSVRISPASGNSPFTFAILRTADGAPTFRLPGQAIDDVRWSPNGHLVGMTIGNIPGVRDAQTGAIVASAGSGRFAGWSPDGKWFYVARDTGLYAQRLSGGEPVRISALGVPVSTATP